MYYTLVKKKWGYVIHNPITHGSIVNICLIVFKTFSLYGYRYIFYQNKIILFFNMGFPGGPVVNNLPASAGDARDTGFDPWFRKIPWRREWQPTPVLLPGKFPGQGSMASYSPWGC